MNNVVTIREFTRNIYKYLHDGGFYVVSVNGKDSFTVMISKLSPGIGVAVVTKPIVTTSGRYACGCKKGETKLCKTHHRT